MHLVPVCCKEISFVLSHRPATESTGSKQPGSPPKGPSCWSYSFIHAEEFSAHLHHGCHSASSQGLSQPGTLNPHQFTTRRLGISKAAPAPQRNLCTDHVYEREKKSFVMDCLRTFFLHLCKAEVSTNFPLISKAGLSHNLSLWFHWPSAVVAIFCPAWRTVKGWCPYPPLTSPPACFSSLTQALPVSPAPLSGTYFRQVNMFKLYLNSR